MGTHSERWEWNTGALPCSENFAGAGDAACFLYETIKQFSHILHLSLVASDFDYRPCVIHPVLASSAPIAPEALLCYFYGWITPLSPQNRYECYPPFLKPECQCVFVLDKNT